jgi:hypothetical protein
MILIIVLHFAAAPLRLLTATDTPRVVGIALRHERSTAVLLGL